MSCSVHVKHRGLLVDDHLVADVFLGDVQGLVALAQRVESVIRACFSQRRSAQRRVQRETLNWLLIVELLELLLED